MNSEEIDIISIALEIQKQTSKPILAFKNSVMVLDEYHLYNPSDHIYKNKFIGKVVDQRYLQGGNFFQIQTILDRVERIRLEMSFNAEFIVFS